MYKGPNEQVTLSDGKIGIVIESKKYGTKLAIIDRKYAEKVKAYRWCLLPNKDRNTFYAQSPNHVYLHRFLLNLFDPEVQVDHKNGNGLDCTRRNMRTASNSNNQWNKGKYKNNITGYKGVLKHGDQWRARIQVLGKRIHLGTFKTAEKAYQAYIKACREHHGKFSRTH